jgi:hypothetical protein
VLFVEAVRTWLRQQLPGAAGWLGASRSLQAGIGTVARSLSVLPEAHARFKRFSDSRSAGQWGAAAAYREGGLIVSGHPARSFRARGIHQLPGVPCSHACLSANRQKTGHQMTSLNTQIQPKLQGAHRLTRCRRIQAQFCSNLLETLAAWCIERASMTRLSCCTEPPIDGERECQSKDESVALRSTAIGALLAPTTRIDASERQKIRHAEILRYPRSCRQGRSPGWLEVEV